MNNEPVVLGKVKKNSTGNPLVVVILFVLVGIIIIFLPIISSYFGDYKILDLIKNGEIIDFIKNHDDYITKTEEETTKLSGIIDNKTTLNNNIFKISNINLSENNINFQITTKEEVDFDKLNYYLELSKSEETLVIIKLTGISSNTTTINYTFKNKININKITGTIKEYTDDNYPKYTLSTDESGLSSITCTNNYETYEYTFDNNKLTTIKQNYTYYKTNNDYNDKIQYYNTLTNTLLNNNISVEFNEYDKYFIFKTTILLKEYNKQINNNYYKLNTESNKIYFEMNAKGYDCK